MTTAAALAREDRIALAEQAFVEGRIIQHSWRSEESGRQLVCALAAFGPQDISDSSDCPHDLMPRWMAEMVPTIEDGIAADQLPWFMVELLTRAKRWHVLDDAAWERIRTGFMIAAIHQALESARSVQPTPEPEYWPQVVNACEQAIHAVEAGDGLDEATARAAVQATAWAAEAVEATEAWAADAAARAASSTEAAEAAAAWAAAVTAAVTAAEAVEATEAWAAAWKSIAETLFKIIDAELV